MVVCIIQAKLKTLTTYSSQQSHYPATMLSPARQDICHASLSKLGLDRQIGFHMPLTSSSRRIKAASGGYEAQGCSILIFDHNTGCLRACVGTGEG